MQPPHRSIHFLAALAVIAAILLPNAGRTASALQSGAADQPQATLAGSMLAQPGFPWQPSETVHAFAADCTAQSQPAVAIGADETAYAVWVDWRNGSPSLMWAMQPAGGA
jgi:hypothetical protein